MYFLKNDHRKFIIFWNARCACTSVKNWFYFYEKNIPNEYVAVIMKIDGEEVRIPSIKIHQISPYNSDSYANLNGNEGYMKILIVRNPYDRFASVLSHPILTELGISMENPNDTADKLLELLEEKGCAIDHHFEQQLYFPDKPDADPNTEITKFDKIIRCEDGDVTKQLNKIFDSTKTFEENKSTQKITLYFEQKERVRKLYANDFKLLYW